MDGGTPSMARSTVESATRDRLLTAALDVFAAKGYHGAIVDDIVAASGTSKGAFYHYFPSKQGIFLTLIDELTAMVEQSVETAIASEKGALTKVEAALRVVLETAAVQRDLVKILLVEAVGLGPTLEQKRLEIHRRFAEVIRRHLERAVAEGDIPSQDTMLAARAWIGALNEVITQWLVADGENLLARLPSLRALLLRSIGAPAEVANEPARSRESPADRPAPANRRTRR